MNIYFQLKDYKAERSSVRVCITHKGKRYVKPTGISIPTSSWSQSRQKCSSQSIQRKLREIKGSLEDMLCDESTEDDIQLAIARVLVAPKNIPLVGDPEITCGETMLEHFEKWANIERTGKCQRQTAYRTIKQFNPLANWQDLDQRYYLGLVAFLDKKGLSKNYQGQIIKCLKAVCNEGLKLGLHNKTDFKSFKRFNERVDKIYLTEAEMAKLWQIEAINSTIAKARDLAWLGYLTCARFSDYSRLSLDNIADGKIRFIQQKTSQPVVLPCSPRVVEILQRNGGHAPRMSQQRFNDGLKELCKMAGIDTPTEIVLSKGLERIHKVVPKYTLVCSHSFRRSAATNLYLSGVPLRSIMQLTGHSKLAMLENYLCISKDEVADQLADNPFFK